LYNIFVLSYEFYSINLFSFLSYHILQLLSYVIFVFVRILSGYLISLRNNNDSSLKRLIAPYLIPSYQFSSLGRVGKMKMSSLIHSAQVMALVVHGTLQMSRTGHSAVVVVGSGVWSSLQEQQPCSVNSGTLLSFC
jgi:hypothetical protein